MRNGRRIDNKLRWLRHPAATRRVAAPPASIDKSTSFAVLAFRATGDVRCQNFANDRAGSLAPIDLMEAVLYSAELSDAQMDGVAAWLKNKFAAYV